MVDADPTVGLVLAAGAGSCYVIPQARLAPLLSGLRNPDGAGPYLRTHPHVAVEGGDLATGDDVDIVASAEYPWTSWKDRPYDDDRPAPRTASAAHR